MLRAARAPTRQLSETERRPVGASAERSAQPTAPALVHSLAHVPVEAGASRDGAPVAQLTKKDPRKRAQSEAFWAKKNARLARQADAEKARTDAEKARKTRFAAELSAGVKAHQDRVTAHTGAHAQAIRALTGGKRPTKPADLSGKDPVAGNLTAHHLLPYNFIRDEFADALEKQDTTGVARFMAFAGRKKLDTSKDNMDASLENIDSSEAYRLMAPKKAHTPSAAWKKHQADARKAQTKPKPGEPEPPTVVQDASTRSGDRDMQEFFRDLTWSPHNIIMGPAPALRSDDPHEGLDARLLADGSMSKSSKLARALDKGGMASMSPAEISSRVVGARHEAGTDAKPGLRNYDPKDWVQEGGKFRQAGADRHEQRRAKWTRKNNWQKLQHLGYIESAEADQMKAKVKTSRAAKWERRRQGSRD